MNAMYIEITENGFISRYKDIIIFEKNNINTNKEILEYIAITYGFKYKLKHKNITFIAIDNYAAIARYKTGIEVDANSTIHNIVNQCNSIRKDLNVNSYGLLRYYE